MLKKILPLLFFFLFITNVNALTTIFSDNFDDTSITDWDVNLGTWSALNGYLDGGATDGAALSHVLTMDANRTYQISYRAQTATSGLNGIFQWFTDQNGIVSPGNISGYQVLLQDGVVRIRKVTNGVYTNLISGTGISLNVYHDVNVTHTFDGNILLYIDGNFIGSAKDTSFKRGSKIVFGTENGGANYNFDDLLILQGNEGVTDGNVSMQIGYSGFGTGSFGKKFTNTLSYGLDYTCLAGRSGLIRRFINSVNDVNYSLLCNGSSNLINGTYQNPMNGVNFFIKFSIQDLNFGTQLVSTDTNFNSDLNAPIVDINFSNSVSGFTSGIGTVNMNLTCFDDVSNKVNYTISQMDTNYLNALFDSNTTQSQAVPASLVEQTFVGTCRDLAGNVGIDTNNLVIFAACFKLVNEQTGVVWPGADINSSFSALKATSYETGSSYNFKSNADSNICFTSVGQDTIRFDINYVGGLSIYREFNLGLVNDLNLGLSELPVCLATEQDFFEQIFISSSQREVTLINELTECYSMSDYTKYAFQDALSARAFTISMPYSLETNIDGNSIILALINGAAESQINLDVLVFKNDDIQLGLQPDELSVSIYKPTGLNDSNTLQIVYQNLQEDNIFVNVQIFDGNALIYSNLISNTPNAFTLYFDFTTITINNEILKIVVVKTLSDGTTESISRYFTLAGSSSNFRPEFAAVAVLFIILFGLTISKFSVVFGWFGILIGLVSIAILSFSPNVGYIIFLTAVVVISTVYMFLVYKDETVRAT